jgi:demethylmenaquinone methyltransferase/2-methoxy-6-polyprenyl-1,4-benzoquinol methylase
MDRIYSFEFLKALFDEMSASYDRTNYVTSFGFSVRFRRQFVEAAGIESGDRVLDLMCGRGECWRYILERAGASGSVCGLDLSPGMLDGARARLGRLPGENVRVIEGNALATGLPDASFDRIVMAFGLKTLAPELRAPLSREILRLLRPGGMLSAIEISEPSGWWLRGLYMWYLRRVIPILGRVFLGNPDNYRMLAVYVDRFDGCEAVADAMRKQGLEAEVVSYFHGCATGIVARRPLLRGLPN